MSNSSININISINNIGISIQSIVLKQPYTYAHTSGDGGTISKPYLITKILGGATGMTQLRM